MTEHPHSSQISTVAPLPSWIGTQPETVCAIYDRSLQRRPLRMRTLSGDKLDGEAHTKARAALTAVDMALAPLAISYLGARVRGRAPTHEPVLDLAWLESLPRLLSAAAGSYPDLVGESVEVQAKLTASRATSRDTDLSTTFDVGLDDADPALQSTLKDLGTLATRIWAQAVATCLGPWLIVSGVTELRLHGYVGADATASPERLHTAAHK